MTPIDEEEETQEAVLAPEAADEPPPVPPQAATPLPTPTVVTEGDAPFACTIEGVEMFKESAIARDIEGRGEAFLFKARAEVSGAAVLYAFDEVRKQARTRLAEPGFRPGDVPPWIKKQLTEFALTTIMEDVVKYMLEVHGLEVLPDTGSGEDNIKWLESPNEMAATFVLGSPLTFHAAFNATLPIDGPVKTGGANTIDSIYSLTEANHNRAAKILAAGGKMPDLLQRGGGSGKSSSKKKKSGGAKKRKR